MHIHTHEYIQVHSHTPPLNNTPPTDPEDYIFNFNYLVLFFAARCPIFLFGDFENKYYNLCHLGSKIMLFLLYGQQFRRYMHSKKILFRSVSQNINSYIGIDIQRNGTEQNFFRMLISPKLLPVEQKQHYFRRQMICIIIIILKIPKPKNRTPGGKK